MNRRQALVSSLVAGIAAIFPGKVAATQPSMYDIGTITFKRTRKQLQTTHRNIYEDGEKIGTLQVYQHGPTVIFQLHCNKSYYRTSQLYQMMKGKAEKIPKEFMLAIAMLLVKEAKQCKIEQDSIATIRQLMREGTSFNITPRRDL